MLSSYFHYQLTMIKISETSLKNDFLQQTIKTILDSFHYETGSILTKLRRIPSLLKVNNRDSRKKFKSAHTLERVQEIFVGFSSVFVYLQIFFTFYPLQAKVSFLYPLKTSQNLCFYNTYSKFTPNYQYFSFL